MNTFLCTFPTSCGCRCVQPVFSLWACDPSVKQLLFKSFFFLHPLVCSLSEEEVGRWGGWGKVLGVTVAWVENLVTPPGRRGHELQRGRGSQLEAFKNLLSLPAKKPLKLH